jgi:hypothetical protein
MKKFLLSLGLVLLGFVGMGQVRIYEFFGGGGNAGAPYNADYVVLYNAGASSVSLATYSIQYAATAGTSWSKINLAGNIASNSFFLVKLSPTGATGVALPTPDVDGTAIGASATNGKLVLMSNQTTIGVVSDPQTVTGYVDFVGFGTANASEGTPAPAPSNTLAIKRNSTGADTGNNSVDFTTSAPNPKNSASAPLPITLISFKANITENQQTVLKWATASEKDNDYFEVERSKNALDFESIGKIKGKGTIDLRNDYTFTDESPLKGINYYRLKQVDFDGQYSYTRAESVIRDGDGTISLFPNPTANILKINFEDTEQIENTTIYNMMGRVVKTIAGNQGKYEISELPQGKYILQIGLSDGRIIRNSFVKN